MSNEMIYGGPLRAEVVKSPNRQSVKVEGDGISTDATSGDLVKSISMALNEVYRPEVTMDDRYDSVAQHLRQRREEIQEKRDELQDVIDSYENTTWLPSPPSEYVIVQRVINDYLEHLDDIVNTLEAEQDHAFGNKQDSEA